MARAASPPTARLGAAYIGGRGRRARPRKTGGWRGGGAESDRSADLGQTLPGLGAEAARSNERPSRGRGGPRWRDQGGALDRYSVAGREGDVQKSGAESRSPRRGDGEEVGGEGPSPRRRMAEEPAPPTLCPDKADKARDAGGGATGLGGKAASGAVMASWGQSEEKETSLRHRRDRREKERKGCVTLPNGEGGKVNSDENDAAAEQNGRRRSPP